MSEDVLAPAEVVVVSNGSLVGGALEAGRLYHGGRVQHVVVPAWASRDVDREARRLGVPLLEPADLARAILERSGVPAEAIVILDGGVEGTNQEIVAVGAWVGSHRPASLLFLTARTHTARARWLLSHRIPATTRVAVGSPSTDDFSVASWWRDRTQSREVATEYLRWLNSMLLRDRWGDTGA